MKSLNRRPEVLTASILVALAVLVATLVASPSLLAQQRGRCAVTEVPGHLVLPDGKVHESGELKFCFDAWPDGDGMSVHVLHAPGRKVPRSLTKASALLERADEERFVLVAAQVE